MVRRFIFIATLIAGSAHAFCGFYVAKGDAKLFNRASQVVFVRDGDRSVVTMASDFHGEPRDFAVVIPVPTLIERGQIHVVDKALIDHLDAYSAPRLVEYFDDDPCRRYPMMEKAMAAPAAQGVRQALESTRQILRSPPRGDGLERVRIDELGAQPEPVGPPAVLPEHQRVGLGHRDLPVDLV